MRVAVCGYLGILRDDILPLPSGIEFEIRAEHCVGAPIFHWNDVTKVIGEISFCVETDKGMLFRGYIYSNLELGLEDCVLISEFHVHTFPEFRISNMRFCLFESDQVDKDKKMFTHSNLGIWQIPTLFERVNSKLL